ncbi:MAG: HD domain-containing protein [Kiloniellales bacterium]|nr:HD domain-containing protein [Kiloniellales bacterium]
MLKKTQDAYDLLVFLGAPGRLVLHAQLVGEAADELLDALRPLGLGIREDLVRLGVVLHDAGKILHPGELDAPGDAHEAAGERLLLEVGVQPEVARCCLSYARYESMEVSFEELLIALSDRLWKGVRVGALELRVVDAAAERLGKDRWDLFADLDVCFERIAAKGDRRLARSRSV